MASTNVVGALRSPGRRKPKGPSRRRSQNGSRTSRRPIIRGGSIRVEHARPWSWEASARRVFHTLLRGAAPEGALLAAHGKLSLLTRGHFYPRLTEPSRAIDKHALAG